VVFASAATRQHYLVKFLDSRGLKKLQDIAGDYRQRFTFSASPLFSNVYSFDSTLPRGQLQAALAGKIDYLESDLKVVGQQTLVTNDPGFTSNPDDVDKEWGLAKTGFPEAWTKTTGSQDVVVAVLDSGIDATHEDLQNINFVPGFNFLTQEDIKDRINSDDNGHGTLVAGILGATANNKKGIVGTNWNISLMPLKVLNSEGKGDSSDISEAIVWAADHGAGIINLSLGGIGFGHDTTLANAIAYAFKKNIVLVAAAGNDLATTGGSLDDEPVYPICDDNGANMVIGVAAIDHNDLKPEFSDYGKNCIDVVAPGKRILSTINHDPFTKASAPNSYAYASGTSMAVPLVSGEAALIKSLYPNATNVQVRDRIIASADQIDRLNLSQCGDASCAGLLGAGRINVKKGLESQITTPSVVEGDLVKVQENNLIYYIFGGQKNLVSPFVYNRRFVDNTLRILPVSQLANFPEGPYALPLDGTLVKFDNSPTVYAVSKGKKRPVTLQIFNQRGFQFNQVNTLSFSELNSWLTGDFFPPTDGTLLRTPKDRTVYWVVDGVLHPSNLNFYLERGLNIFPVLYVSDSDLPRFSRGEAYIR
jgi:hypothetical protein